jgi:hypothetical protein
VTIGQRNTSNLSRPALVQTGEKLWLADRDSNRTTPAVADISWSGPAWPPLVLRSRLRLRTDDFLGAGRSGAIANLLVASWKTSPLFTRRERAPNLVRVSPRAACPRTCTSCYRARARNSDQGQCDVDGMHRDSARANIRRHVYRPFRRYGYPSDLQDPAVQNVPQQAELLSADWAAA